MATRSNTPSPQRVSKERVRPWIRSVKNQVGFETPTDSSFTSNLDVNIVQFNLYNHIILCNLYVYYEKILKKGLTKGRIRI